jgi:hypothetical protein
MNINELDSNDLAQDAKFKDALNPVMWDRHEHLKNAVKDQIMVGIDEYCQYLGLNESHIADILVAGDNAGYAYSSNSTIDVVIVANLDADPVYRELFNENKYKYNGQHQVKIHNQYVQFYVQPSDEPVVSRGSYSLLSEDWVQVPVRKLAESTDTVAKLKKLVEAATPVSVIKPRKVVVKETKPVKYGYGSDYIAEVGMTPDGTNPTTCQVCNEEIPLSEVGMTPDGTNPTTCQVCNEQAAVTEEKLINDFVNFCSDSLGLENPVNLKLKRDPEWPKRNKTFGRYNSDTDILEVAIGQRHVMDTFRTIAHELTHKRQHEVTHVPEDAGETGSKFENEANAAAGVLMRTWGQMHPEFFAMNLEDLETPDATLDEGLGQKLAAATAVVAALAGNPAAAQSVQGIIGSIQNIGTMFRTAQNITRAGINQEVQQEIVNYIQANGGQANAQNLSHLYKLQRELQNQESDQQPLPGYMQQANPTNESASGYIPTKAQAKDPRYSMALTVDIKPGAVGKNANKLKLNTNSQGQPQLANPNGLVQRMSEELELFKKGFKQ